MPIAAVETALRLKNEAAAARTEAVTELKKQRKEIDSQLKLLGVDEPELPAPEKGKKAPCSVCQSTEHDGRFHRSEPKPPKT